MKQIKILSIYLSLFLTFSCNNDDENSTPPSPENFNYSSTDVFIDFYTEGQTVAPNISWNGDIGNYALSIDYPGLTIDSNTGIISWNEDLPRNTTICHIDATNENGSIRTTVNFHHIFSGSFTGGYNYDFDSRELTVMGLQMTFGVDHIITVLDSGNQATGEWHGDTSWNHEYPNSLWGSYEFLDNNNIGFDGGSVYSSTQTPYVEGFWSSDTEEGYFRVNID